MIKEFYSNGKLLVTGEYAILDGALGLAIPTKFGQSLSVTQNTSGHLHWKSLDENGNIWFEGHFNLELLLVDSSSDAEISKTLLNTLQRAQDLNPNFLVDPHGYNVETKLDFPRNWGLGSSSTLINNIAQWADINPYNLLSKTFGGSGYDIACAQHYSPIVFRLENSQPKVDVVDFDPPFKEQLFFVYLNTKQNSREGISLYRQRSFDQATLINTVSDITLQFIECKELAAFEKLVVQHETLLSATLGLKTMKEKLFPEYPRTIKSLGAWGGDFILVTGDAQTSDYFKEKGYETIIPYSQMVLS